MTKINKTRPEVNLFIIMKTPLMWVYCCHLTLADFCGLTKCQSGVFRSVWEILVK